MNFTILDWNIGGAKVLEEKTRQERDVTRTKINRALTEILTHQLGKYGPRPDVVTLQEVVQWQEPDDQKINDLLDEVPGYSYFFFKLIDSKILSSRAKWNKVMKESDWNPRTYFAQGNAFLIRNNAPHFPVWDLSNLDQPRPDGDHFVELVHMDSGLYFGDRNTEPRAALVAHFIYDPQKPQDGKRMPLDIFIVNVHLTTLSMEREGVPEIDTLASKMRMAQLDVVFNGIVSRYNSWRRSKYPDRGEKRTPLPTEIFDRYSPVWIITGDFNFTEESSEYEFVKRANFVDTVPMAGTMTSKGRGTKASGNGKDPTLTLDYVFAGPKFVSLDPAISPEFVQNKVIRDSEVRASDHYPVLATMYLTPLP
jgi:endonuclease/exonuclease/phosphatase family metal-dependent hydrolase